MPIEHLLSPLQPSSEQVWVKKAQVQTTSGSVVAGVHGRGEGGDVLRWKQRHQLWGRPQLSTFPDVASVALSHSIQTPFLCLALGSLLQTLTTP